MTRLCRKYDDYEANDGGDSSTRIVRYNLYNATTNGQPSLEEGAQQYVLDNTSNRLEGFYRASMRLSRKPDESGNNFDVELTYTEFKPATFIGYSYQFTSGTKQITQRYAPVVSVLGDADPNTLDGAIAVDEKGVPQGADVDVDDSLMVITATLSSNQVYYNDLIQWERMKRKVNAVPYGKYAAGELRFVGYSFQAGGGQKDRAAFTFRMQANETISVPLADQTGVAQWDDQQTYNPPQEVLFGRRVYINTVTATSGESPSTHPQKWAKKTTIMNVAGWDHFTVGYESFFDINQMFTGSQMRYAAVHRVYEWVDYSFNSGNGTGWPYFNGSVDLLPPAVFGFNNDFPTNP